MLSRYALIVFFVKAREVSFHPQGKDYNFWNSKNDLLMSEYLDLPKRLGLFATTISRKVLAPRCMAMRAKYL